MADDSLEDSAKLLVCFKEGTLNASPRRGNPPRIRKKNKNIYNDDEDTTYFTISRSPKKQPKVMATSSPVKSEDVDDCTSVIQTASMLASMRSAILPSPVSYRTSCQILGNRLKNLLKLPKAHKWVVFEFFYSNLDEPLLLKDNEDFSVYLQESFPHLKTRQLRRVEWAKIRRLMGKPRRCSAAFFNEERSALENRRNQIRLIQQRNMLELTSIKELPEEIPMHLVIGTKVTARLRQPQDGLFTGQVKAFDPLNNTYRITFDRTGLGTHSIPDYEVLSIDPQDTIPLSAFSQKRKRLPFSSPPKFVPGQQSPALNMENDPLLNSSPLRGLLTSLDGGTYGGFPIQFLILITRLSKILQKKQAFIEQLKDQNSEAERLKSYQTPLSPEFQKRYAVVVLELESLNKILNDYLVRVQQYCQQIAPEQGLASIDQVGEVRKKCDGEALEMRKNVAKNFFNHKRAIRNEKVVDLVTDLTSLMLQIRTFAKNDFNSFEFKSIQDTLRDIKSTLDTSNLTCFQNNIEVHVNYVQSGLSRLGNLHAFASPAYN